MANDLTQEHWGSPHVTQHVREGVKALIVVSGRCLLIQERHADGRPFWTLPGGGLRPDESPVAGLRREAVEELCCRLSVEDRVGRFWYAHARLDVALSRYEVYSCQPLERPTVNRDEGVFDYCWTRPSDPPQSTVPQVRYLLDRAN